MTDQNNIDTAAQGQVAPVEQIISTAEALGIELADQVPDVSGQAPIDSSLPTMQSQGIDVADIVRQQEATTETAASVDVPPVVPALDIASLLAEKTGGKFATLEDLVAAATTQAAPAAPTFENETTKQIYESLLSGQTDSIRDYLNTQSQLASFEKLDEQGKVKAHLRVMYPEFDDEMIEQEFQEKYTVDEVNTPETRLKREKLKVAQRLKEDAAVATATFAKFKDELKLPVLQQVSTESQQDQSIYSPEQLQTVTSFMTKNFADPSASSLSIPIAIKNDKYELSTEFKLDEAKINEFESNIGDYGDVYYEKRYFGADGNYNSKLFARDMYMAANIGHLLTEAAKEGWNQGQLHLVRQGKNYQPNPLTPSGSIEPSGEQQELEALERAFRVPAKKPGQSF